MEEDYREHVENRVRSSVIDPQALGLEVSTVRGDEVAVLCPFHDDSKPSASFNVEKGLFHCFACGASMKAERLAKELGGSVVGLETIEHLSNVKEEKEWRPLLYSALAIDHPYLMKRGITNDEIRRFGILHTGAISGEDSIGFPIRDRFGNIVGINVRRSAPHGFQSRYTLFGEKAAVWPLDLLGNERRVTLVEGVISAIKLRRADIPAFATMGAGSLSKAVIALNGRRVTVMFDDDYAGYVGAAKLILSSGASVLVPGAEYDNLDKVAEINEIIASRQRTFDLHLLAAFSGDKSAFWITTRRWFGKIS
jgi:DNA primase